MQAKMQQLQQQLEVSQKVSTSSSTVKTAGSSAGPKSTTPRRPNPKVILAKPAVPTQKTKNVAGKKMYFSVCLQMAYYTLTKTH